MYRVEYVAQVCTVCAVVVALAQVVKPFAVPDIWQVEYGSNRVAKVTPCNPAQVVDDEEVLKRFTFPSSSVFGVESLNCVKYLISY